jgi:hypothetical protein
VVAAWFDRGPVLLSSTATATWRSTAWDDATVIWTAVIIGVVGLLCLIVGLWPDTPATVASRLDDVELERRPLESALQQDLESIDGVSAVRVKARRGVHARVVTNRMIDTGSVEAASRKRLDDTARRLAVAGETTVSLRADRAAP